jgi:hypothetical protein
MKPRKWTVTTTTLKSWSRTRLIQYVRDLEEVIEDKHRLTRELDVLLNGEENAAEQASLCDIVGQVATLGETLEKVKKLLKGLV